MPFVHNYHLMLQDDNALPHIASICTQFMKAGMYRTMYFSRIKSKDFKALLFIFEINKICFSYSELYIFQ